eukprot:3461076-Alexandrium_andersonii.AAC.1
MEEACDIKTSAQQVSCDYTPNCRCKHVFCDLNDFLTPSAKACLDTLEQQASAAGDDVDKRTAAVDDMVAFLNDAGAMA